MYLGDFPTGATIYIHFNTNGATGVPTNPSSAFDTADFRIYKNDSLAQRTSANGLTMSSGFDSTTGRHCLKIDTTDNSDAGFWVAGADYTVELDTAKTVDSISVDGVIVGKFSIDNRGLLRPTVAQRTLDVASNGALDADSITAILAAVIDGTITLKAALRALIAAEAGKATVTDNGTTRDIVYKMQDGSTTALAVTVRESDGGRTNTATPNVS